MILPHTFSLHRGPSCSQETDRTDATTRLSRAARKRVFNGNYFTLYAGFSSTKKQRLRLAFGVRAGAPTVRNRAKRLAREAFRLNRHKFSEGIEIVIAAKKDMCALSRRDIRGQILDLLDRASKLSAPLSPEAPPAEL